MTLDDIRGRVYRGSADPGFQTAVRHAPDIVVQAADAADVQRAVAHAADRRMPVTARATGHGATSLTEGLLITTNRLDHVRVDPRARTADVGAGATWDAVVRAAARHGLAPLSGSAPTVGVAGYTLGGGLGPLARRYGYAADHVVGIDVVTPDGARRHVTADSEPDLFWAMRGAGRSFGIVTALRFRLFPVAEVLAGSLTFPPARLPELLHHCREWAADLPPELTSSLSFMNFPGSGRRVLQVFLVGTDVPRSRSLIEPLRRFGAVDDSVRPMPYPACSAIFREPIEPHGYQGDAVVAADIDPAAAVGDPDVLGPRAGHPLFLQVHHLGGATGHPAAPANAVGHRSARFLVRVVTPVRHPAPPELTALHGDLVEALGRGSTARMLNFLFGDNDDPGRTRACYEPATYERLTRLKRRIDPADILRLGRTVPAAPA
jgi:FAD/FMN-containing dehydrogenase